jgi:phospholipase C
MTKKDESSFDPSRRRLLAGVAAAGTVGIAAQAIGTTSAAAGTEKTANASSTPRFVKSASGLPPPKACGIDHIVVVMMENRSFDHMLGWVPGANGKQAGLSFPDANGVMQPTHNLAPNFQNCDDADPDHSYDAGHADYNDGAMDNFLHESAPGDVFPIGYFTGADLPFFAGAAANFTICDHYFSGILSSTWPNRIYMHSGQTDRIDNATELCRLPTVWSQLQEAKLTGKYYFSDIPFIAIWGARYAEIAHRYSDFQADAAAGTLPDVCFVDPHMFDEDTGISKDDHPFADVRDGQVFLNNVYQTLAASPQWAKTLLVINYDEWGGFFDHVPPALAPVSAAEAAVGNDGRLGIRVPCVLIGPRVKRNHVESTPFDPNSILNFIAWRFGLPGLGVRAETSNNLAVALDFGNEPNLDAPDFGVEPGPYGEGCRFSDVMPAGSSLKDLTRQDRSKAEHIIELQQLKKLAQRSGFPV